MYYNIVFGNMVYDRIHSITETNVMSCENPYGSQERTI